MTARLSVAPPVSPRPENAAKACSRKARLMENCRNGSTLERLRVITGLPG